MAPVTSSDNHLTINDITYHALVEGPAQQHGSNKYVVLCHAVMTNLRLWNGTVPALHSAGYTTIRIDSVGHGESSLPLETNRRISMEDMTRDVHDLVVKLTGQSKIFAIIGISISGVHALRYGMLFPDDVEKVISVASPNITAPSMFKDLWSGRIRQFEEDLRTGSDVVIPQNAERWTPGNRPADDHVRAESMALCRTCSLEGFRILATAIQEYDYASDIAPLKQVQCLIIAGNEDKNIRPEVLEELSRKIDASFVLMEGAGHFPNLQKPAVFEKVLVDFLAT